MLLAEGLDLWVFTPSLHTPLLSSFQPAWPHTVLRRKRKAFEEGLEPFSEQVFRTRVWEERLWGHTDEAAVLEMLTGSGPVHTPSSPVGLVFTQEKAEVFSGRVRFWSPTVGFAPEQLGSALEQLVV